MRNERVIRLVPLFHGNASSFRESVNKILRAHLSHKQWRTVLKHVSVQLLNRAPGILAERCKFSGTMRIPVIIRRVNVAHCCT